MSHNSITVPLTGLPDIDGVLQGSKWNTTTLTYSFPTTASSYYSTYSYPSEPDNNFEPLNGQQQLAVRAIFDMYQSVTNLQFVLDPTPDTPSHLRFAMTDYHPSGGSTAHGYYPWVDNKGGDSWYNNTGGNYDSPVKGNYAYHTFMHEIGHTLGLKHGHETYTYSGVTYPVLPTNHDSQDYSIMTYRSYQYDPTPPPNDGYNIVSGNFPQTLMMDDIAALQHMYGAHFDNINSTYSWNTSNGTMYINGVSQGTPAANIVFLTIWDGGGVDTYDFSNYATNLRVDLRPGNYSILDTTNHLQLADLNSLDGSSNYHALGNIYNAYQYELNTNDFRSLIENAIGGSGNDTIIGNSAINTLTGGSGADSLYGLAGGDTLIGGVGADFMYGGIGDDTYYVDNIADFIDEGLVFPTIPGGGFDTLYSTATWYYESSHSIEQLIIAQSVAGSLTTIVAGAGNNFIYGNTGNNNIFGNWGSDWIWAGAGLDNIDLQGDPNNVSTEVDTVYMAPGSGYDVIWNFTHGVDHVDLTAYGIGSWSNLNALLHGTNSGNAYISLPYGDTLMFVGINFATLTQADFLL